MKPSEVPIITRRMVVDYAEKHGVREALRRFKLTSTTTITRWRHDFGLPQRQGKKRKYTPKEREKALKMALEIGLTAAAAELRIPVATISSWRKECGQVQAATSDHVKATIIERALRCWPGWSFRVCATYITPTYDMPMRSVFYIYPRGYEVPHDSVPASRFSVIGGEPKILAYSDGFLSAKAARLAIHPHAIDAITAAFGNAATARDHIECAIYSLLGFELVSVSESNANRATGILQRLGLFDYAKNDAERAAVAALIVRDLIAVMRAACFEREGDHRRGGVSFEKVED